MPGRGLHSELMTQAKDERDGKDDRGFTCGQARTFVAALHLVVVLPAHAADFDSPAARVSGHAIVDQSHDGEVAPESLRIPTPESPSHFGEHHRVKAGGVRWSFTTSQPSVTLTPARAQRRLGEVAG